MNKRLIQVIPKQAQITTMINLIHLRRKPVVQEKERHKGVNLRLRNMQMHHNLTVGGGDSGADDITFSVIYL